MSINNFKSSLEIYKRFLIFMFSFILGINIFFYKQIYIISFTNLFLIIIPNWIATFLVYKKDINETTLAFENYLKENYPEKINNFCKNYHDNSNPNTKPIFVLFSDKEFSKDKNIEFFKQHSNKITFLLVATSALSIMIFLISTVFIFKVGFSTKIQDKSNAMLYFNYVISSKSSNSFPKNISNYILSKITLFEQKLFLFQA